MLYLQYAVIYMAGALAESIPVEIKFSVLRGNYSSVAKVGSAPGLVKRDDSAVLDLINSQTYYSTTLEVGSEGDRNSVLVDTGSSDLWLIAKDVVCSDAPLTEKRSLDTFSEGSLRPLTNQDNADSSNRKTLYGSLEYVNVVQRENSDLSKAIYSPIHTATSTQTTSSTPSSNSCILNGSFNTAASNSFMVNASAPGFSVFYADSHYANGIWGTDIVAFGTTKVSDCSFAVANDTNSNTGVLGIGLAGAEVTNADNLSQIVYTYENFPLRLKNNGIINKVLYSLYLNSNDSSSGSVLFGAVDHAKYSGHLQTVPIINIYPGLLSNPAYFHVVLDSISLESSTQKISIATSPVPALLDSGSTLTHLPTVFFRSLVSSLNGSLDSSGHYQVSCDYKASYAHTVFNFSGIEIRVPLSDLILSSGSSCYLGVLEKASDGETAPSASLGDNFLRNAYVVYNLEDYEISLAQADYAKNENIEVVTSSVPSAVQAPGYSSTSVVQYITDVPIISLLTDIESVSPSNIYSTVTSNDDSTTNENISSVSTKYSWSLSLSTHSSIALTSVPQFSHTHNSILSTGPGVSSSSFSNSSFVISATPSVLPLANSGSRTRAGFKPRYLTESLSFVLGVICVGIIFSL